MDDKKGRIIQSAMDVFQEKGIEKAKVSDIVKGAGIAQGTFYLYFSSKFAVMPAIAEEMVTMALQKMKDSLKQTLPFIDQLTTIIDITFDLTRKYRTIYAMIYAGLAQSTFLSEWEEIYAPYYEWMTTFLTNAQQRGIIQGKLHPNQTAAILIGLIESSAEQVYLYAPVNPLVVKAKKEEVMLFAKSALGCE